MSNISEVLEFLDHLGVKGIIPKNTALGRKSAAKKFFEILDGEEQGADFVSENFDRLYERFKNRNAMKFKGNSLDTYRSRVKSVLEDFFQWKADPVQWERSLTSKSNGSGEQKAKVKPPPKKSEIKKEEVEASCQSQSTRKLTLPLGPSTEVKVEIPLQGLSTAELHRLGMFLFPYCNDISTERWESTNWPMIPPAKKDRQ